MILRYIIFSRPHFHITEPGKKSWLWLRWSRCDRFVMIQVSAGFPCDAVIGKAHITQNGNEWKYLGENCQHRMQKWESLARCRVRVVKDSKNPSLAEDLWAGAAPPAAYAPTYMQPGYAPMAGTYARPIGPTGDRHWPMGRLPPPQTSTPPKKYLGQIM